MTPEEYCALLQYIQANNSWGKNMYEVTCVRHRVAIKYVDACYDSRDGRVWLIKLRLGGGEGKRFRIESPEDIKKIYQWLDRKNVNEA